MIEVKKIFCIFFDYNYNYFFCKKKNLIIRIKNKNIIKIIV